ncbi:DUF1236 domain-containing protein [Methylocella silvestris]|uniref:DUF1236 domain-containing protein n=1 Tax=Methylocella silvestris TaxID=199596 RepID=A0A2J7TIQ0_METSI|nr:DUF1236 domain-containing protein [Methylocella silvestris]PNG26654.1 hypothetical protein CR492_06575 [Methylocella silvestris]
MSSKFFLSVLMASTLMSGAAVAQGLVPGAERGAQEGGAAAGPVGAIVGGAVGAAAGTVGGILGVEQRPRFRSYVQREHVTSYRYEEPLRVGAVLPNAGVTYYDVPPEYQAPGYRYTVVNGVPVLVDPNTGRIVEVIE